MLRGPSPAATLRAGIQFKDGGDRPVPVIDPAVLKPTLAEISERIDRPADETLLLKSKSGALFGFVPGKNGRYVDSAATGQRVVDLMAARAAGTATPADPAVVALGVTPPDLSEAEANGLTHEVTLVGAWTTRFVSSERNHFGANIRLPARFINGTVVQPGRLRLLGCRRARDLCPRLRNGRDHRERPDQPERRDRRRDLLGLDDAVQRRGAGRLPDPLA